MCRYLSSADLHTAWMALDGAADAADLDVLEGIVAEATQAALHVAAASVLVGVARRRPFGDRSDHMALVAADLMYQLNGWSLPGDRPDEFDVLVRRVAENSVSVATVAEELAVVVRPSPA